MVVHKDNMPGLRLHGRLRRGFMSTSGNVTAPAASFVLRPEVPVWLPAVEGAIRSACAQRAPEPVVD